MPLRRYFVAPVYLSGEVGTPRMRKWTRSGGRRMVAELERGRVLMGIDGYDWRVLRAGRRASDGRGFAFDAGGR